MFIKNLSVSKEILLLSMEFRKNSCFKNKKYKLTYKRINILKFENYTDYLRDEITLNKIFI